MSDIIGSIFGVFFMCWMPFWIGAVFNWKWGMAALAVEIFVMKFVAPIIAWWLKKVDMESGWDVNKVAKNTHPTVIEERIE